MRKMTWVLGALALTLSLAATAEPAPAAASQAAPKATCGVSAASLFAAEVVPSVLVDAGLFTPTAHDAGLPLCPVATSCPLGCTAAFCGNSTLGSCCQMPGGGVRCCQNPGENIQVVTCPCQGCPGLSQVSFTCH